jgi:predicted O-linked N-acetylglucosamine transferase (SPINDLY family)
VGRGNVLATLDRSEEAISACDRAIELDPGLVDAWLCRGEILFKTKRYEQARHAYASALKIDPDADRAESARLSAKMHLCDWTGFERDIERLSSSIRRGVIASPFTALAVLDCRKLQRDVAKRHAEDAFPSIAPAPTIGLRPRSDKIRIAYFSADLRDHPVAHLTAELFERHDRDRFEVTAYSFGPDCTSAMRRRLTAAFDRFVDVRHRSAPEIAALSRSAAIDIAVDLMGFTRHAMPAIFSMRAAPVQVNYLGFPGTMGAGFMDYIIADRTLIPDGHRADYSEKIAYLPNTYMPSDSRREISDRVFTREEFGLPARGVVFCCFNNSFKIMPAVFERWMRILRRVEGSVLWLSEGEPAVLANLRAAAAANGIEPGRLVFAPRLELLSEHLARHRLADLFLDTLPYNAHTTANDALWAGLPVLTCTGATFAGRVATSLLTAIGLPELITPSGEAYEARAISLAGNPEELSRIRRKLERNRLTTALFDTPLFTKHIEAAYAAIYERHRAGLPPDDIYVA